MDRKTKLIEAKGTSSRSTERLGFESSCAHALDLAHQLRHSGSTKRHEMRPKATTTSAISLARRKVRERLQDARRLAAFAATPAELQARNSCFSCASNYAVASNDPAYAYI